MSDAAYCEACGSELRQASKFCPRCGEKTDKALMVDVISQQQHKEGIDQGIGEQEKPNGKFKRIGWICLILAWLIVVIPGSSLIAFLWGSMVVAAVILSVVSLNRGAGGIGLLVAALIGTPLIYFISGFIWIGQYLALSG